MKWIAILTLLLSVSNSMAEDFMVEKATFAGGCFWCIQPVFDNIDGVTKTTVGYSGGTEHDANYEAVSSKKTAHKEAMQVEFDPNKVSFRTLVETFMQNIDPTDAEGQFVDKGPQYQTAVYYHNAEQKQVIEQYFKELESTLGRPIQTEIEELQNFFAAEDYHQKYYEKNPERYNSYKNSSGRKERLKEVWGDKK